MRNRSLDIRVRGRRFARALALACGLVGYAGLIAMPSNAFARPDWVSFNAVFAGTFAVTGDVGKSVLFEVQESGSGVAQGTQNFSYRSSQLQNLARVPDGCGPSSSSAVEGFAVLLFADGSLSLRRVAGTSCFAFPVLTVEEQWVVSSGTGSYLGATGSLRRQLSGDVRFRSASGSFDGTVKFVH